MHSFTSRKRLIRLACSFLFIAFTPIGYVLADDPPGGGEPGDPDAVPLDGGLSLLIAAGAAYGVKKVYEYRNSKEKE
jgi:hypothetical protein